MRDCENDILALIPPSPAVTPPPVDLAALRREAERRLLRRTLLAVGTASFLSMAAVLLALFIFLRVSFLEGTWMLALPVTAVCLLMLSGGGIALALFIQRRENEWL